MSECPGIYAEKSDGTKSRIDSKQVIIEFGKVGELVAELCRDDLIALYAGHKHEQQEPCILIQPAAGNMIRLMMTSRETNWRLSGEITSDSSLQISQRLSIYVSNADRTRAKLDTNRVLIDLGAAGELLLQLCDDDLVLYAEHSDKQSQPQIVIYPAAGDWIYVRLELKAGLAGE